jgi:hypothetical protein
VRVCELKVLAAYLVPARLLPNPCCVTVTS